MSAYISMIIHVQINLIHGVPCGGVVKAKTHCDILLLSKADTQHILQHFPEGKYMYADTLLGLFIGYSLQDGRNIYAS